MDAEEDKKYSYLDEYKIIKTLGAGYHAQVKLGMDDNGNYYAIKRYKKETANLATLQHELGIMKVLQHENLVRLIDVRQNATYKRKDQTTYSCFAIILEYVGGGELFDFVAETGKFSEKVTRTYFHQMMNGLHYMHTKGYAHRDIKPQNILLGRDFVLKLADFGFSCLLRGKDGSGILHTKLGTEGYMAPEIPTKNYDGARADIFAAGVILFIMYAGNPPFEKAAPNDPYYKLIKQKNFVTFWKAHSRRRPINYFSQTFKDLFQKMVAFLPGERLSIQQIAQHAWVNDTVCSQQEIKQQFVQRLQKLDQILEQRRKQQQQRKNNQKANSGDTREGGQLQVVALTQIYDLERENTRTFPSLAPINPDDFIIDESPAYAVAVLIDFLKHKKIELEDKSQILTNDVLALRPVEFTDNGDNFTVKYEFNEEFQDIKVTQTVEVNVRLGNYTEQQLSVLLTQLSGDRFYFKKIAKELKGLYTYCRV